MADYDARTLAFYAAGAREYAAARLDAAGDHLDGFLARLSPGALILELGCGAGRDAADIESRGFRVEPTDGVPEMAAQAEATLGRPVRVMRFDELDADCRYDGVLAAYSLLHVPREALVGVIGRIHRALKPGGWHCATFKAGEAGGRDRLGRYYNYPSEPELRDWYARAGAWEEVAVTRGSGRGYDGEESTFLAITLRKRALDEARQRA